MTFKTPPPRARSSALAAMYCKRWRLSMPREMGRRNPPAERKGCELPGGAGGPGQVWSDLDKSRRGSSCLTPPPPRFSLALLAERLGSCASPGEDLYCTLAPCRAVPAEAAAGEGKLSSGALPAC